MAAFSVEIWLLPFSPFFFSWLKLQNIPMYPKVLRVGLSREFLRSPAREPFRTQQFLNWPIAVHWLLTTFVPESALDATVRTLQTTSQNEGEDVRKFGRRLMLQTAAL
jgi:hypothetical protein